MWDNRYSLKTTWTVRACLNEVLLIIGDPQELPRWWSSVYSSVLPLHENERDENQLAAPRSFLIRSRGYLPYRLVWILTVESVQEKQIVFRSSGDFTGKGSWHLQTVNDGVEMIFDWNVVADKELLRLTSRFLKPIYEWNHRWAMKQGFVSLNQEIQRRRSAL
jgi:hypothetical protein